MTEIATTKPTDPMEAFQQQIVERLRKDIADLLPEDAVKKLVEKAVEDSFFKERVVPSRNGYELPTMKPSWFVEEVAKAAEPMLRKAVEDFIAENETLIHVEIKRFLTAERLSILIADSMANQLSTVFHQFLHDLRSTQQRF